MLTKDDIDKIHELKKRGYSIRKAAIELGFNPKTTKKYWGDDRRPEGQNPYFRWMICRKCNLYFPAPKFLKKFECPGCGDNYTWKKVWYNPINEAPAKS